MSRLKLLFGFGTLFFASSAFATDFPLNDQFPENCSMPSDADAGWEVVTDVVNAGTASLKAETIQDGQVAAIECTFPSSSEEFRFAYKVSSEESYDGLIVTINGIVLGSFEQNVEQFSGDVDWTTLTSLDLPPAIAEGYVVRWEYKKDGSFGDGADTAWIDSVSAKLPAFPVQINSAFPQQSSILPDNFVFTPSAWIFNPDDSPNDVGSEALSTPSIDHGESASLEVLRSSTEETVLAFDLRVSTEGIVVKDNAIGGDLLKLYFDDEQVFFPDGERVLFSGELNWVTVRVSVPEGTQRIRWSYEKDDTFSDGLDRVDIDNIVIGNAQSEPSLGDNYVIGMLGGNDAWVLDDSDDSPLDEGTTSIRTAVVADDEVAILDVLSDSLNEQVVSFYTKVSSEENGDFLRLYLNDELIQSYEQADENGDLMTVAGPAAWSGEVDWTKIQVTIPAGQNTVSWRYEKNASATAGEDRVYLDLVSIPIAVSGLTIVLTNDDVEVNEGETVTFDASNSTPAFSSSASASDLIFSWTTPEGLEADYSALDEPVLTFTAPTDVPNTEIARRYFFFVTVTDPTTSPATVRTMKVELSVTSLEQSDGFEDEVDDSGSLGIVLFGGLILLLGVRRKTK